MIKKQVFGILAAVLLVVPLFHNCGQMQSKTSTLSSLACETDMLPVFEKTYKKFFADNTCTRCHAPGTHPSTPKFADSNSFNGLQVFMTFEPDRIESKLRAGHQGYSYSNLEPEMIEYKSIWTEAMQESSCTGSAFVSSGKTIDFFEPMVGAEDINILKPAMRDTWQTLTWNLDDGRKEETVGVQFSMEVKVEYNSLFYVPQQYIVNNLKIKSSNHDLEIYGIYIMLNGKTYLVSTFKELQVSLQKGNTFQSLTDGSSAAVFDKPDDEGEKYENADRWTVKIERITKK